MLAVFYLPRRLCKAAYKSGRNLGLRDRAAGQNAGLRPLGSQQYSYQIHESNIVEDNDAN